MPTNISDDVSNLNCGTLPDGRAFLVSNAMVNIVRDPLYVGSARGTPGTLCRVYLCTPGFL